MKIKTLLRFLLCFLIIGCLTTIGFSIAEASASSFGDEEDWEEDFSEQFDDVNDEHTCKYNVVYQKQSNGTHVKISTCTICKKVKEITEECGRAYTQVADEKSHEIHINCSDCGYVSTEVIAKVSCVEQVIGNEQVGTRFFVKYKCRDCGREWSESTSPININDPNCKFTSSYKRNNDGTHIRMYRCSKHGEMLEVKESCKRQYHSISSGNYHRINIRCDCGYVFNKVAEEACTGEIKSVSETTNQRKITYQCKYCGKTWNETVKTKAGPSAGNFFEVGKDFKSAGEKSVNKNLDPILHIQSLIMMFGALIAVIVVIIYGIQWATATSAKRQELKSSMWPLGIGISLLALGPKFAFSIYNELTTKIVAEGTVTEATNGVAGIVINTIQTIGYIVAIVMVLWIGIQWLTNGTANKKQELKGRLINLALGALLIVGGVTILGWVYDIASKDMNTEYEGYVPAVAEPAYRIPVEPERESDSFDY